MQNIRAFGMDVDVSNSKFNTIAHAVAVNENRAEFARRSIYTSQANANSKNDKTIDGKYRLEKGFLGAHSDIGGGYESGDLSNASLMWMIKQAQEKGGIKFGDYSKYKQVNNPIVHDSAWSIPFSLGGEFRWATDDSKDYDKTKIFNNFAHLGLNWNDTKIFENPNNKKLDKIEDYTATHIANKNKGFFDEAQELPHREEVLDSKSVLMAHKTDKVIAINDYLHWLKCSYKIDLKYENKDLVNNPVRIPNGELSHKELCSGKPLQTYLKKK